MKGDTMKKFLFVILGMCVVFISAFFLLQNIDTFAFAKKDQITRIESFSIEVLEENGEKLFDEFGYKNVNAVSEIIENKKEIVTKVSVIEDYYDVHGTYLKTIVKVEEGSLNLGNGKSTGKVREKEFKQPLALFAYRNTVTILTDDEKEQVKNQVRAQVKKLPKS
jgi:hypothetical protein